jgi:hypothetical protein
MPRSFAIAVIHPTNIRALHLNIELDITADGTVTQIEECFRYQP